MNKNYSSLQLLVFEIIIIVLLLITQGQVLSQQAYHVRDIRCGVYNDPETDKGLVFRVHSPENESSIGSTPSDPCPRLEISNKRIGGIHFMGVTGYFKEIIFRNITLESRLRLVFDHSKEQQQQQQQQQSDETNNMEITVDNVHINCDDFNSAGSRGTYDDTVKSRSEGGCIGISRSDNDTKYIMLKSVTISNSFVRRLLPKQVHVDGGDSGEVQTVNSGCIALYNLAVSDSIVISNNNLLTSHRGMTFTAVLIGEQFDILNNIVTYTDEGIVPRVPGSDQRDDFSIPQPILLQDVSNYSDTLLHVNCSSNTVSMKVFHVHSDLPMVVGIDFEDQWYVHEVFVNNNTVSVDTTKVGFPKDSLIMRLIEVDTSRSMPRVLNVIGNSVTFHGVVNVRAMQFTFGTSKLAHEYLKNINEVPAGDLCEISSNTIEIVTKLEPPFDYRTLTDGAKAAGTIFETVAMRFREINNFKLVNISNNNLKRLQLYRMVAPDEISPLNMASLTSASRVLGIDINSHRNVDRLILSNNIINAELQAKWLLLNLVMGVAFSEGEKDPADPRTQVRDFEFSNNSISVISPGAASVAVGLSVDDDMVKLDKAVIEHNFADLSNMSIVACSYCFDPVLQSIIRASLPQLVYMVKRSETSSSGFASFQASGRLSTSSSNPIQISIRSNTFIGAVAPNRRNIKNLVLPMALIGDQVGSRSKNIDFSDNTMTVVGEKYFVADGSKTSDKDDDDVEQTFVAPALLGIFFGAGNYERITARNNKMHFDDGTLDRSAALGFLFDDTRIVSSSSSLTFESNEITGASSADTTSTPPRRLASYSRISGFSFVQNSFLVGWEEIPSDQFASSPPTDGFLGFVNCSSSSQLTSSSPTSSSQISLINNRLTLDRRSSSVQFPTRIISFTNNTRRFVSSLTLKENTVSISRKPNCAIDAQFLFFDYSSSDSIVTPGGEVDVSSSSTSTGKCNRIYYGNGKTKLLDVLRSIPDEIHNSVINIIDSGCEGDGEECKDEEDDTRTVTSSDRNKDRSQTVTKSVVHEPPPRFDSELVVVTSPAVDAALTTTSVVQSFSMASMAIGAAATPALGFSIGRQQAMMNYALKAQQGDCRGLMPGTVSSEDEAVDYSLPVADSPTQMKLGTQHPSSPAAPFYVGAVVGNFVMIFGIVSLNQLIGHIATKIIIKKYSRPSEYNRKKDLWKNFFYVFANSFVSLSLFYMIAILLSPTLTTAVSILAGTSNEVVSVGVKIVCFLIALIISSVGVYFVVWSTYIRKPRREVYRINKQEQEAAEKKKELGVKDLFKKLCKADGEWKIPLNERTTKETHAFQISEPCYASYKINQWFAIVEIVVAVLLCLPPLFAQLSSSGKSSCIVHGVLLFLILLVYTILLLWKNPKKLRIMRFFVPAMAIQQTLVVGLTLIAVLMSDEHQREPGNNPIEWLWQVILVPLSFQTVMVIVSGFSSVFPFLIFIKKLSARIMAAKNALRGVRTHHHHHHHHHHRNIEDLFLDVEHEDDREMSLMASRRRGGHDSRARRRESNGSSGRDRKMSTSLTSSSGGRRDDDSRDERRRHHRNHDDHNHHARGRSSDSNYHHRRSSREEHHHQDRHHHHRHHHHRHHESSHVRSSSVDNNHHHPRHHSQPTRHQVLVDEVKNDNHNNKDSVRTGSHRHHRDTRRGGADERLTSHRHRSEIKNY